MCERVNIGNEVWRVILLRRNASELLVRENRKGFVLPRVDIPEQTRVAHALNARIKAVWDLDVFSLYPLPSSTASLSNLVPRCHVMEANQLDAAAPEPAQWLPISAVAEVSFAEVADLAAIRAWRDDLVRLRSNGNHAPFGRPGCLAHLRTWVQEVLQSHGVKLGEQVVQFNASKSFSLTRFETDGGAVWFKAVGEPNLCEFAISRDLARFFPGFVPRVLAIREDWNAWLALDVEGTHPNDNSDIDIWTGVAATLANLQIASIGNTLHLLEAGCKDVRACTLVPRVDPFLEVMGGLMDQQPKLSPPPLSRKELAVLGMQLKDLLSRHQNFDILDTLGHLDFNPGNILVSENRSVFLDWAEACIGHPFLTFRYLAEYMRRLFPAASSWESQLTSSYIEPWRCFFGPEEISRALALSPILAVTAYALSLDAWRDPAQCARPETAGYLRSLTRRMKREAASWAAQTSNRVPRSSPSIIEVSSCPFLS